MTFFTDKIDNIRNTITNVDSTASSTSASFIAPKEKLQCFTTIGQDELNKLITASKPTTCLLDPVPTKLLKELLTVAEQPLLNIINSSLSLGHVPKPFKLAVIKPLIKKPKLDPCELANYWPISNLPFMSKILEKVVSALLNVRKELDWQVIWPIRTQILCAAAAIRRLARQLWPVSIVKTGVKKIDWIETFSIQLNIKCAEG